MLRGSFGWSTGLAQPHSLKQFETPFFRRRREERIELICVCKKGSKKKAAKSNSAKTPIPIEKSAEASAPARVNPNSNVPVRRQQQWAKTKKAIECNTGKTKFRQSYRKEKLDVEEQEEEELKRAEAAAEAEKAYRQGPKASLRSMRNQKYDEFPPVLLVDGYNILKAYRAYVKQFKRKHPLAEASSLEEQREVFHTAICQYSELRGTKCVLVYDAVRAYRDPNDYTAPKPERTVLPEGVDVVWCRDRIADYWIMKEMEERKEEYRAPYVCVATDDKEIINSAWSAACYHIPSNVMIDDFTEAANLAEVRQEQIERTREEMRFEKPGAKVRHDVQQDVERRLSTQRRSEEPTRMRQLDAHHGIQELLRRKRLREAR